MVIVVPRAAGAWARFLWPSHHNSCCKLLCLPSPANQTHRRYMVIHGNTCTKLGPVLFAVIVNDLAQSWGARIKFVDDLTVLEVVPRNSPSLLNVVVDDIHAFAVNNNMRLNPRKCKSMTVDFLHYNSCVPRPIAVGESDIEQVSTFKLLGVHLSEDLIHSFWPSESLVY